MDKKLSNAVTVLDAIESYFTSLETYIKQTDNQKYEQIESGIAQCREYRKRFDKLRTEKGDDSLFQFVHYHNSMRVLLNDLYTNLNFELPIGEEISKTRAYRLTEVFDKVTAIYRTYIRDVAAEMSGVVEHAASLVETASPLDIQKYWQKWPNSIDLYTYKMTEMLNKSYHDKDPEKRQLIFEIIENDKRYILSEKDWISPFLSFNCVPHSSTLTPVEWKTVETLLKKFKLTWSSPGHLDKKGKTGIILVTREQASNVVHVLPKALTWGPGISANDIHPTLIQVNGERWKWDIAVSDNSETVNYVIIERMTVDAWRILVPWKFSKILVDKNVIIHKIKEHAFGRPNSYHEYLERPLRQILSTRVATLSKEEAREHDVSLSVIRVTDLLLAQVKSQTGPAETRLANEKLDKIFETAVLEELSRHDFQLKDAILYWADWMRRAFRKDLDSQIERLISENDIKEWNVVLENRVEKSIHDAVSAQLRKTDNVFKDLFDMEHKINEVNLHTRHD